MKKDCRSLSCYAEYIPDLRDAPGRRIPRGFWASYAPGGEVTFLLLTLTFMFHVLIIKTFNVRAASLLTFSLEIFKLPLILDIRLEDGIGFRPFNAFPAEFIEDVNEHQ